jgi:ElaB/YqjD/DUF883 family membrane-anchored ribosome-binding protein
MNPDTPQSGKRNTLKSGRSTAGSSTTAQTQTNVDDMNASVGHAASSARETARDAAHEAAEQASNVADQVREKAESQLESQKERATASLGSMASAVRQTSQKLREEQFDGVAQYVERAADQLERFSNHLRERDLNQLADEARQFARQQPALFIGTSFAAGILAARFIKASSGEVRQAWRGDDYGSSTRGYGQTDLGRPFGTSTAATGTTPTTTTTSEGAYGTFGDRPGGGDETGRGGL